MKNLFNIGFVVLILVVMGCNCQKLQELANEGKSTPSSSPTSSSPSNSPSTSDSPAKSAAKLSMDNYNKLKTGISYSEAVNILGKEGEEMSSSEYGKFKTVSYKWQGDNFEYVFIVFQNDKLTTKSQSGLK